MTSNFFLVLYPVVCGKFHHLLTLLPLPLEREERVKILEFLAKKLKMSTFSKSIPCFKWHIPIILNLRPPLTSFILDSFKENYVYFKLVSSIVFPETVYK